MDLGALEPAEHDKYTFNGIVLPEARIVERRFYECTFTSCDFRGAHFTSCRFLSCTFEDCDLSNAILSDATLREPRFERCKLLGIDWAEVVHLDPPWMHECALDHGGFVGLSIPGATITKCTVRDTSFAEADLSGADLRHTDFTGTEFTGADLRKADLRHAKHYVLDPRTVRVEGLRCTLPDAVALLEGLGVKLEETSSGGTD